MSKRAYGPGGRFFWLVALILLLVWFSPVFSAVITRADPGWYDASWQHRKKITIDSSKVSDNLTDFPLLINLAADGDLAADAQNDGDDILFTGADGTTKLSHEIEDFDGGTGELVAWVKVPGLSASVDTEIYLYYGYGSAANQEDVTGVWSNHYVAVWHLKEDPSGTPPQMLDATANNHDGTTEGSWSSGNQVPGLIDGSLDFNSGIDKVKVGTFDVVAGGAGNDGLTLETWFYSHEKRDGRFISKATSTNNNDHWWMLNARKFGSQYRLRFRLKTGGTTTELHSDHGEIVPLNQWVYAAATYDGSDMRLYQDADEVGNKSKTGTIATNSSVKVAIGNQPPGAGSRRFDGKITEVRVSDIARSAGWLETSYHNQYSPSTFYTLGTEETMSAPTVTTDNATAVEETTATLHGTLDDDGGESSQYRFQYGTTSGGPYPGSTAWSGNITSGQSFSANVTGLSEGTRYYFRAQAKNSSGTGSGAEQSFLTKPDAPIGFTASAASATQINLNWTKGDGAERTMVRRKTGGYPVDRSDGSQVYFGTGISFADSGLSAETTYYYRAWSEVTGSQQWSDNYAQASATTGSSPAEPVAVGGAIYPISKLSVLAPWLSLGFVALSAAGLTAFWLRRKHSQ